MKKLISILVSAFLLLNLTPTFVMAQEEKNASIYTEAKTKNVFAGEDFDFDIYLSGTYDGYAINVSSYIGTEIKNIVPADRTIKIDKEADIWVISTMPGLECVDSEKALIATVTVSTSDSTISELLLSLAKVNITDDSGDRIDDYSSNFGTIAINKKPISVTGFALDKTTATVKTGDETLTLTPVFTPENATNKNVTWSSSDESVATVQNGVVSLLKKGVVTITAVTEDGNYKASCVITIACSHKQTQNHPAESSTCLVQGHGAYTVCKECGEVVSGSDAKLPLADHTYVENADAKYLKSSATCNSKAVYYKSCSVCGVKGTQTFEHGGYDSHNHMGETYIKDYKEATCFEEGYTGDTYCRGCDTKLIPGTAIQKNAHNPSVGWTTDNESHWKVCQTAGCGHIIDKAAHTGGTATCTKKAVCEVCGVEYGTVNVANHVNTEKRNVVEATCTTDGYSGDTYCKDCGVKIADGTAVPAGHKLTKVEEKKATHEAEGNIAYYVCQGCGKLFADANAAKEIAFKDTVIKKGEHSYSENYKSDAENHWKECDCGSTIEKAAHKFGEWKVTKEATTDTKGSRERVCSVCGYKAVEEIAAIVGNGEKTSPTTGDASNYTLWITLTFVSITGIEFMAVLGRKKREK